MEAARQATRLGRVESIWERGDEVKEEKVAGWIKGQTRIMKSIEEIWRVKTMSSDGIQPYSECFGVEEEIDFPTEICLPCSFTSVFLESSTFVPVPELLSSFYFAAFCLLVLLAF